MKVENPMTEAVVTTSVGAVRDQILDPMIQELMANKPSPIHCNFSSARTLQRKLPISDISKLCALVLKVDFNKILEENFHAVKTITCDTQLRAQQNQVFGGKHKYT